MAIDGSLNPYLNDVVESATSDSASLWLSVNDQVMKRNKGPAQYICERHAGSL